MNVFFQEHILNYTAGLTRALCRMGANVSIFTVNPGRYQGAKYFPLRRTIIPRVIPFFGEKICLYHWLARTVKNMKTRVFHLNRAYDCEIFLKLKEKYAIPIIYTNHHIPEACTRGYEYLERQFVPILSKNSSRIITVSAWAKKRLKEEFGINSTTIYHGIDLNKFNPFITKINKAHLGIDDNEKVILWAGELGPHKDPSTLIRAIPLVLREYPNTKFLICGKGPWESYAINLAKKLSLERSLRFLGHVKDLNYFYVSSDVFVSTSGTDTFGFVVAEAMACGKPVIVSNRGAPQEVIGDAGLIFEYDCPWNLADKIITLLENEDLSRKLGAKAYKRIVENFTWEKAARKYLEIYKSV